ncbi:MAG: hypothetical protein IT431_01180 [Phycisphaerales bacterium]|nr:hypothetical protein [Phycisphaerales bacterium]
MSHTRSWWNRRSPRTPASLADSAGQASRLELLESRVLLSDPGSTFGDAQELVLDGNGQATYDDKLPDTSDIDMYTFTMSSPDFVTILADAVNAGDDYDDRVDTQLTVYDYNGNVVGTSRDSGTLTGGTPIDAWLGFVPTAAHRNSSNEYVFYVRVTAQGAAQNGAEGLYTIRVDGESTVLTDDETDAEQDVTGTLSRPLQDIVYKLETGSDSDYGSVATAAAYADADELDPRIDVYDAEGNLVIGDSQSGRLTNALAVFRSEQDTTFYFRVRADEFAPTRPTTGDYTMTLDMIGSTIDLDPVTRIGYVAGDQAGENITELYKITPLATGLTIISVEGYQTIFPALTDPAITLYDDSGEFIAFSDRFFGESPQIAAQLEGGRAYYAMVDGFEIAARSTFHILVEANHTYDEGVIDDHADSQNFEYATPIVWSDWQVGEDNVLGWGELTDHPLVSIGAFTGRIHNGADSDLFVFVPPVDMLGAYGGNIGMEVDEDSDGVVDRDGDAAIDGAPIEWYAGYRPATRVEIQIQAAEDPGLPSFTWADMLVRVYDSVGNIVYDLNDSTWAPALYNPTLQDPAGSLDPARYYADLDPSLGLDFAGGATPFDGVFSLEVWGGEAYYIEVSTSSGSGRYNAFVAVDGFPDPTDEDNWSTIESDTPLLGDSFDGIADATDSQTVSGFIETTNNFNNDPADFVSAFQIDLSISNGGWTGPSGQANQWLDGSAFLERAFVMGLADYPTPWTFPYSIADGTGATLLAGYDSANHFGLGEFDNRGVTVLRESGLAGIEHPLDNDLYTFRADSTGFAEVRINTTQITDWYEEWIADGVNTLVDNTTDDDDFGWYLDEDGEEAGEDIGATSRIIEKTYNSLLDSALRIFDNDFEQVAFNNDNTAMTGVTETRNAGNQGDRTFHDRDARVVFPVVKGQVYYIQVESGQAEQYQAWRDDATLSVPWQHLIGSYELLIHTQPTQTSDDFPGGTDVNAPVMAFDTDGTATVSGEIDNNSRVPFDSDVFTFIAPATAEFTVTASQQSGETLIPTLSVYRELTGGGVELLAQATASSDGTISLTVDASKGQRFFLELFGAGASEGAYDLEVTGLGEVDDHTDWLQFQAAEEITLLDFLGSGQAEGTIESNGDIDVFKLQTSDITDALITVTGTSGQLDPYIEVYEVSVDPYGHAVNLRVAYNDNISVDSSDAQVFLGLTPHRVSGLTGLEYPFYYLVVRGSNQNSDEGGYQIDIDTTPTDDHADLGQYDHATALQIDSESGQAQDTGIVEVEGDSDLFRFTALAAGTARVTVSRPSDSGFLPRLRVIDADGNDLAAASDGSVPGTVELEVVRGQVYYVVVDPSTTATDDQKTGAFTLTVAAPPLDDYPNATEWTIAHPLSFDSDTGDAVLGTDELDHPLNPRIDVVSDTDLFTFLTIASGGFTITFAPLDTSLIGMRAELSVYDADLTLIQTVSDSTPGVPVSVVLTGVPVNTRYYVLVSDTIGNRTGDYQLTVNGPAGSGGGGGGGGDGEIDFDTATEISLDGFNADGSANGVISAPGERDLFKFTAPAGGRVFVQMITPRGSLLDGTLTILDAESETAVVTDDATGIPGVNAAVSFQSAGAGQEYWVVVDGIGTGVGSYTIRVDAEPETFRVFYPAGFTGPSIREFVSLANPNSFDITYSVILRYETGERDQTIVSNQVLAAGSRGGVTISDALNGSPVGARIAPYAIEVRAVGGPIAASMGHFDFGSTTGDAFTSVISPIWSLARLERSPGAVNDFALFFNPHDFDVDVTLTAYNGEGDEIDVTVTVGALRRGGLNLNEVLNLPSGVFGAVVTASASDAANDDEFLGIIVGQSHYDLVEESGFGLIGDPLGGSLSGAVPSLMEGAGSDAELVLFNANPFVTTVTLNGQYVRTDLPDLARILTLQPGETLRLAGAELGLIGEQPLGIAYSANFPITVSGNQTQFGDADGAAAASQAGTGWFFGAAFMNSALAGESYFETLALYNPASTATEVSVNLFFLDGTSEVLKLTVGAGQFAEVRLHETLGSAFEDNDDRPTKFDANEILGRPGLSYFSMFVTAPTPIATSFTHYDLFLQGGWTNSGAALGLINPISTIV